MTNRRLIWAFAMLGMVILSEVPLNAGRSAPDDFSATDVSPDSRFGDTAGGSEQTGRITTVIVDPSNPKVLYAASEFAGIWKSTDAARTWSQSSTGLTTGESGTTPTLAIDETDSRRLIFASGQDDYRPGNPSGGVWVSTDAGNSWRHATISGCQSPLAYRVAFGGGHAYAVTNCGLAISNSRDLMSWTLVGTTFSVNVNSFVSAVGQNVYVSSGARVHRGAPAFGRVLFAGSADLPGSCLGLATAAGSSSGQPFIAAIHQLGQAIDVSNLVFTASTARVSSLGFWARQSPFPAQGRGHFCCGVDSVFVARRPPTTSRPRYDVFASDGYRFYQYLPRTSDLPQRWASIANVHVDAWSMAFPSTYHPAGGNCTAYLASDGGIRVSMGRAAAGRSCFTAQGPWARAQSGLHAFGGTSIVGWEQPPCGTPQHNCPTLYLSGADNATWVSTSGGVPGSSWSAMPCCGDSGSANADWALRSQLVINRNGIREVFRSSDGLPPTPATSHRNMADNRPDLVEGSEPPQQASFSQVMTLTSEASVRPTLPEVSNGDYVQVSSSNPAGDTIVRTTDRTTWKDLSPGNHFPFQTVKAVATSNGHRQLVVYILTSSSASNVCNQSGDVLSVKKGTVDSSGTIGRWEDVSGSPADSNRVRRASSLWVNPYDPQQLYVTDLGSSTATGSIKSSSDGGTSWRVESELGRIATNNGEFRFGCFGAWCVGRRFCSLQQVLFSRERPKLRIAILFPGGVAVSRDGGETWRAIDKFRGGSLNISSLRGLIAYPYSGYLDTSSQTGGFSLYLALRGRGLIRVDSQ